MTLFCKTRKGCENAGTWNWGKSKSVLLNHLRRELWFLCQHMSWTLRETSTLIRLNEHSNKMTPNSVLQIIPQTVQSSDLSRWASSCGRWELIRRLEFVDSERPWTTQPVLNRRLCRLPPLKAQGSTWKRSRDFMHFPDTIGLLHL